MTRRPAVTLIEVLMAMFIMAIGMMALLVLFPLGALSMAQALKDDRCASTASMAENVAIAMDIRHDSAVNAGFATPSTLVYVDPYGKMSGLNVVGTSTIPRVSPSFVGLSPQLADRWFSLPDDITFLENGTPDIFTSGGPIDRGRRYSYAYLLKRLSKNLTHLYVVVYSGRPVNTLAPEFTYGVSAGVGANGFTIPAGGNLIKRGGWVLDAVNGYFYRVTNTVKAGSDTTVDVYPNLIAPVTTVVPMQYVAEVFDKGTSWLP